MLENLASDFWTKSCLFQAQKFNDLTAAGTGSLNVGFVGALKQDAWW